MNVKSLSENSLLPAGMARSFGERGASALCFSEHDLKCQRFRRVRKQRTHVRRSLAIPVVHSSELSVRMLKGARKNPYIRYQMILFGVRYDPS